MPVYHDLRCIFIHVPKTGGTSIAKALAASHGDSQHGVKWNERGLWDHIVAHPQGHGLLSRFLKMCPLNSIAGFYQQHLAACLLRDFLRPEAWSDYFKFAIVRNPWDRAVSIYTFTAAQFEMDRTLRGHHERAALFERCSSFTDFARLLPLFFFPDQVSFIDDGDGNLLVDFLGRFESLDSDFAAICARLKIECTLPHLNASAERDEYRRYYTEETRAIVGHVFARDVERFGYEY